MSSIDEGIIAFNKVQYGAMDENASMFKNRRLIKLKAGESSVSSGSLTFHLSTGDLVQYPRKAYIKFKVKSSADTANQDFGTNNCAYDLFEKATFTRRGTTIEINPNVSIVSHMRHKLEAQTDYQASLAAMGGEADTDALFAGTVVCLPLRYIFGSWDSSEYFPPGFADNSRITLNIRKNPFRVAAGTITISDASIVIPSAEPVDRLVQYLKAKMMASKPENGLNMYFKQWSMNSEDVSSKSSFNIGNDTESSRSSKVVAVVVNTSTAGTVSITAPKANYITSWKYRLGALTLPEEKSDTVQENYFWTKDTFGREYNDLNYAFTNAYASACVMNLERVEDGTLTGFSTKGGNAVKLECDVTTAAASSRCYIMLESYAGFQLYGDKLVSVQ